MDRIPMKRVMSLPEGKVKRSVKSIAMSGIFYSTA